MNLNNLTPEEFLEHYVKKYGHRAQDELTYDRNVANDSILCYRCVGTGNELYSRYRRCSDCNGSGVSTRFR